MIKLRTIGAIAVISTMLAGPALAQGYYGYTGGSQSGQAPSEYGGQQDSRQYSPRNYVEEGYAYNDIGPSNTYRERSGFWPGDVAANVVGGALGTADAALGAAGAIATAPFRGSYASMDLDDADVSPGITASGSMSCSQRYRSFDPASGTYLGYDGQRHPCT